MNREDALFTLQLLLNFFWLGLTFIKIQAKSYRKNSSLTLKIKSVNFYYHSRNQCVMVPKKLEITALRLSLLIPNSPNQRTHPFFSLSIELFQTFFSTYKEKDCANKMNDKARVSREFRSSRERRGASGG